MARRPCAEPGCPTITDATRCPTHTRERDRARGTRQDRGYDAAHDRMRADYQRSMDQGETFACWRCGDDIDPVAAASAAASAPVESTAREVTMPRKVCAEPGCPTLTDRTRCNTHERASDRARGTRQERGYGADHDREAKRWRDAVRRGELVTCWRCGDPITDPNDCHLGHDDHDRRVTRGPEHGRDCNLSAAGRARHGISPND